LDHNEKLADIDPEMPQELGDRETDNWRSLIAIADLIGVGEKAREVAIKLSTTRSDDSSIRIKLLQDLKILFDQRDRWHTSDLIKTLTDIESSPWGDWKAGKPISTQKLSSLLKPFGIKPKQLRIGEVNKNGYEATDFGDTFDRYISREEFKPSTTSTVPTGKGSAGNSETLQTNECRVPEIITNPDKQRIVESVEPNIREVKKKGRLVSDF